MKCLTPSIHGGGGFWLGLLHRDRCHAPLHAFFPSPATSFMVTRGDGSSLEAREMNGLHAPPTGDHEGPHNPTQPRSPLRIIRPPASLHGFGRCPQVQ